jgi:DinB superfamily
MNQASQELLSVVAAAEPHLRSIGAPHSANPSLPGGWSARQVLGHLIDSASNNHQRFVRAALQSSLDFPAYDQNGNIRVQAVQEADWDLLVTLWSAYNRYLAHLIAHLPAEKLSTECRIGDKPPVTLEFLVNDYLVHLLHHLEQLGAQPE